MRFVLVHGGLHGAWCWEKLIPRLEALGHEAVAMDLPGHGTRSSEHSTLEGYRDAVVEVLQPGDVLVGHSMGCGVATLAADAFPDLAHIVYVTGALPVEGMPLTYEIGGGRRDTGSVNTMSDGQDGADNHLRVTPDGKFFTIDHDAAVACFYHDCTTEVARWAYERLTPQDTHVMVSAPISVPNFWSRDLPRSFILCTDDRAFPVHFARLQARRLGVRPLKIATSHSPFLSRPAELAELLVEAVHTEPIGPLLPDQLGA